MIVIIHSKRAKFGNKEIPELIDIAKALSHRLNNALSIVLTNSQILINQIDILPQADEKLHNYLHNIESVVIKSGSLIHQFQEFLDYMIDQQLDEESYQQMDQIMENLQISSAYGPQSFNLDSEPTKKQNVQTKVGHISILIVDDEKEIRHALSYALSLDGHHVITASDGNEALDILKNRSYDVVFADLKMPGMNGLELASCIKEIDSDTVIILMTGWNVQLDREKLDGNTINAVLLKPFNLSEVYDLIATFLP